MRYNMISFSVLMVLFSQDIPATPKADSILAFNGGAQAKFVWSRWAWCNEDYTPKTQAQAEADGRSLMLFDTDEGTERALATGLADCHMMRISRTGRWVTFVDNNTTYIVDMTAASPVKKKLMSASDCTYWSVHAMWIDPVSGTEYLFCLDNAFYPHPGKLDMAGTGIWKVKLNSDGTADLGTAAEVTINGLVNSTWAVDESFSVSADGNKLGGAFPWPDTYILDIPTGNLDLRHNGSFGCQPNLAPDNSYRFYHCLDDHTGIRMFAADMQNQDWYVDLVANLDGLSGPSMDFNAPRWSNHVQYFHATWPMDQNPYCGSPDCSMEDNGSLWSKSAEWVQTQLNMDRVQKFYLGKFSADFTAQEKSILIASDPRYFQYGGDAWLCNGTTFGDKCDGLGTKPTFRGERIQGLSVVQSGAFVNIRADGSAAVRITDAQGRLVRMMTGNGSFSVDTRDLAVGAYVVSAQQHGNWLTKNVTISIFRLPD